MGGRGREGARGGRVTRNPARRSPGKQCSARRDALKRLGLEEPPEINSLALAAIQVAGSKRKFIEYARTSDHAGVMALIEKWDSLSPSDQRALSVTDLCAACDLKFPALLGEVTAQAFIHNSDVSKLMAAVYQPRVVMSTIKSAVKYLGPDGVADRKMLHTHSNFLPVPKSSSTIFRFQQQINNSHESDSSEATSLPSFESDVITFNAAQRGKLLPAIVDAEMED